MQTQKGMASLSDPVVVFLILPSLWYLSATYQHGLKRAENIASM